MCGKYPMLKIVKSKYILYQSWSKKIDSFMSIVLEVIIQKIRHTYNS